MNQWINPSLLNRAIGRLQTFIDNREGLAQFGFSDTERRICKESIPAHERVEPCFTEILSERLHLGRRAVERRHWLERFLVPHQLNDAEETDAARRSYRWMTGFEIVE